MKQNFLYIVTVAILMVACNQENKESPEVLHVIVVSSDGNGIANASAAKAEQGSEIALTYTANDGYRFFEWLVVSGNVEIEYKMVNSGWVSFFIMPDEDVEVKAIFMEKVVVSSGSITMTTIASKLLLEISFTKGYDSDITIDWGDGEKSYFGDELKSSNKAEHPVVFYYFTHSYSSVSEHIITIKGDNILIFLSDNDQLTSLDVSAYPALLYLSCFGNQLKTLDVSHNYALEHFNCCDNQLTNLDMSHNSALVELNCSGNQLTNLDVRKNTLLKVLYCSNNQITTLDMNNVNLFALRCQNNSLTTLDLSHIPFLTRLNCANNRLPAIDASAIKRLFAFDCSFNQLTASALDEMFSTFNAEKDTDSFICIEGNPGESDCDRSILEEKNWNVVNPEDLLQFWVFKL